MSFLRPAASDFLLRWSEAAAALAAIGAGVWLMRLGGYFLSPLGATVVVLAFWWLVLALRRVRFERPGRAPGLVEVDEGQVGYLGPTFGGYVSLRELTEVRLLMVRGERHWRLKQTDGQVLLIPHGAAGAGALFNAFATLPGADMAMFTAALDRSEDALLVWRRPAQAALT